MAKKKPRYFKIRRKSDNLYSSGGEEPRFDEKGKIWSSWAAVSNHLSLIARLRPGRRYVQEDPGTMGGRRSRAGHFVQVDRTLVYEDCELVEYELAELEVKDCTEIITEKKEKKRKEAEDSKALYEERQRQERLAQYKELQKEFENDKGVD